MKIISVVNQKGGVGKTTTATNLAKGFVLKGLKVLFIDFDPQGNSTTGFGIDKRNRPTVYDLMKNGNFPGYENINIEDVIVGKHGMDILPNSMKMSKIDLEFAGVTAREMALNSVLIKVTALKQYDVIIIDCPPSLSIATLNALTVSDSLYIPIQSDLYALEGLSELTDTVALVQTKLNPSLQIKGIFVTIADPRTNLHQEIKEQIKKYFPSELMDICIRRDESLRRAVLQGKSIFEYKMSSNGAKDYMDLTEEIMRREGLKDATN